MNVIIGAIHILFNYLLQVYLNRFEEFDCNCAYDVRKDISKTLLMVFYVLIIGKILVPDIPRSARYFMMIFTLIFDVVFVSYIFSLKQKNCKCNLSQDMTTTILYYYYLLMVFLFVLSISLIIMFIPINLFIKKN